MKTISFILLISGITLITSYCNAKRPKHKPKPYTCQRTEDQDKESHHYQPNPVVLAGVSQIMNSALHIAQDPHNRPNVGHSVASIVHGIATIIIEKLARKKIDINDKQTLQEYCDEICLDISKEITDIINTDLLTKIKRKIYVYI